MEKYGQEEELEVGVWTATLGLDHLVWDSRSSSRLIFGFLCSTIASGMSEGSWMLLT